MLLLFQLSMRTYLPRFPSLPDTTFPTLDTQDSNLDFEATSGSVGVAYSVVGSMVILMVPTLASLLVLLY